jgi:glycine/D-amino acid oxidase-like deaminating enzyme
VIKFSKLPDGKFHLETPAGKITARHVVLAAGAMFRRPDGLDFNMTGQRFVPAQTVILATAPMSDAALKRALPGTAAVFDGRSFLNYFRRMPDNRILFGGVDAMTDAVTEISAKLLQRTLYKVLPTLAEDGVTIETYWSGYVDPTRSLLPSVRRLLPGLYEACGFSGQGHVLTALAGEAIAEDIFSGGKSERLARLTRIAPPDFPRQRWLAKLGLMAQWAIPMLHDLVFSPHGAVRRLGDKGA